MSALSHDLLDSIILAELKRQGPARAFEIGHRTGLDRGEVRAALCRLEDRGLVGHGYWCITESVAPPALTVTSGSQKIGSAR